MTKGLALVRFKLLMGLSTTVMLGLSVSTAYASSFTYHVKSGDSLWSIASNYHTTVQQLKSWNHLSSDTLHPGEKLTLNTSSHSTQSSQSTSKSSSLYTVVSGDSPWSVAHKLGVSLRSLESANGLSSKSVLHIGQSLHIPGSHTHKLSSRDGSPDASVASGAVGSRIARYAHHFLGVSYKWGGTSPSGFDCSGLVRYVFAHFGISLTRTSYDQFSEGTSVARSNLAAGDIVFFDTYGSGASHDGIYIGNDKFINAASTHVEVDSLDTSYWGGHYVGARRVQ